MAKHSVAKVGELPEGGGKLLEIENIEIGIYLIEGTYHAYRNMCPHAGAPVCNAALGKVLTAEQITIAERERPTIRCPWHGWEFDLSTGCHTFTNARLKEYPTHLEGDEIMVVIPEFAPPPPPPVPATAPTPSAETAETKPSTL
jgi:nitrite reductase/ring-hydroxylating ferredoxin subunit